MTNILKWFEHDHLSPKLQEVVKEFAKLAHWIDVNIPDSAEKTVALRKLLEGKDAAVRAAIEGWM